MGIKGDERMNGFEGNDYLYLMWGVVLMPSFYPFIWSDTSPHTPISSVLMFTWNAFGWVTYKPV